MLVLPKGKKFNALSKVREELRKIDAQALLLTSKENRRYLLGQDIDEGIAIVTATNVDFFTDSRYVEAARKAFPQYTVYMVTKERNYDFYLRLAVENNLISYFAFEEDSITYGEYKGLEKVLEGKQVTFVPFQKTFSDLRMTKTEEELNLIQKAQEITDQTFHDILAKIREGISETDLKTELIYQLYKNGSQGLAFDPVVVSGPNTSMPHGVAGSRKLQSGDFITLDFGAKWDGYCADMTRTVALGEPDARMKEVYDTVLRAQQAGIAATKAGVTGADVDEAARCVIREKGYEEFFGHGYGHGVGLEVHESPSCSPSWKKKLAVNCVCSAEPGIYLPGMYGVRIEDLVIVTEDGCKNLTKSPKSLIIL